MLIFRAALLVGVALLTVVGFPATAVGEPPVECAKKDPLTGVCLLVVSAPGPVQEPDAVNRVSPVQAEEGDDGGEAGPPEPCSYTVAVPPPPLSHPVWAGRTPDDGAVYLEACPRSDGYGSGVRTDLLFVATGAEPPVGPAIDPRVLAEQAISQMVMRGPEIGMAPPPGSTSGLVGLPVWMWTERGENTVGPVEQSASAGGVTVVATGQVSRIVWDMGDGTTVVCGAGTDGMAG